MFKAPFNDIIVSIDQKYLSNLNNAILRANVYQGTQIKAADYVNVIGTIHSLPVSIENKREYEGYSLKDIKVGDKAIFRYDVVWNFVELENGLSKFRNLIFYEGKDWWKANILQVFAVIRNGSIKMVNGYVMVENMAPKGKILMLRQNKKETAVTHATITQIGNNITTALRIDTFPGDTVYFNPNKLQEYEVRGKKYGILRQSDILGKQIGKYGDGTGLTAQFYDN